MNIDYIKSEKTRIPLHKEIWKVAKSCIQSMQKLLIDHQCSTEYGGTPQRPMQPVHNIKSDKPANFTSFDPNQESHKNPESLFLPYKFFVEYLQMIIRKKNPSNLQENNLDWIIKKDPRIHTPEANLSSILISRNRK
jgi:hypothetical protein